MKLKYRKGVFLVVYAKSRTGRIEYLLLHRILHWRGWEFPKGGIEKGESALRAAERELKEETGLRPLKIVDMHMKGRFNYPRKLADRPGIKGMTWSLYAVHAKKSAIKIDRIEHSAYKWLSFKESHEKLKFRNKKRCLALVDKYVKNHPLKRGGMKMPYYMWFLSMIRIPRVEF